jgi:hypothetical protein
MINTRFESLNNFIVDPMLIDRAMEFGEALNWLERQPGIITSKDCTDLDYMMEGYQEYLEEQGLCIEE